MRLVLVSILSFVFTTSHGFEQFPGEISDTLSNDPKQAAQRAIETGDYRLILVPQCFMGIPGYDGKRPPKEDPRILGRTCDELLGSDTLADPGKLESWAREYNVYIQQHNKSLKSGTPQSGAP